MDDLYVLNNPWSVQSMEKHTSYCAMMRLGMPIPETWMIPPKSYEPTPDLKPTLKRYAKLFDLGAIGKQIGYPMFMKPYDGGGWRGVSRRSTTRRRCARRYEESGKSRHAPAGGGARRSTASCAASASARRRTSCATTPTRRCTIATRRTTDFVSAEEAQLLRDTTLTINAFFGWDFNSCESLRKDGVWYPIDFANPCPDSQVTSLHYHFPWLVKAYLRWSIFCAVTKRPMRKNLDWEPFYEIAATRPAVSREARALRGDRRRALRDRRGSRSSARSTCRTSTRSRGSSSAPTAAKDAVRAEGDRALPGARGRAVHRAVLGPRPGVARRARRQAS